MKSPRLITIALLAAAALGVAVWIALVVRSGSSRNTTRPDTVGPQVGAFLAVGEVEYSMSHRTLYLPPGLDVSIRSEVWDDRDPAPRVMVRVNGKQLATDSFRVEPSTHYEIRVEGVDSAGNAAIPVSATVIGGFHPTESLVVIVHSITAEQDTTNTRTVTLDVLAAIPGNIPTSDLARGLHLVVHDASGFPLPVDLIDRSAEVLAEGDDDRHHHVTLRFVYRATPQVLEQTTEFYFAVPSRGELHRGSTPAIAQTDAHQRLAEYIRLRSSSGRVHE